MPDTKPQKKGLLVTTVIYGAWVAGTSFLVWAVVVTLSRLFRKED